MLGGSSRRRVSSAYRPEVFNADVGLSLSLARTLGNNRIAPRRFVVIFVCVNTININTMTLSKKATLFDSF